MWYGPRILAIYVEGGTLFYQQKKNSNKQKLTDINWGSNVHISGLTPVADFSPQLSSQALIKPGPFFPLVKVQTDETGLAIQLMQLKQGRPVLPSPSQPLLISRALVLNNKLILCWAVSVHWGAEKPFRKKVRVVSIPVSKLDWLTKESDRQWTGTRQGLAPHSQERSHSLQQLICSGCCCWTLPLPYFHMKLCSLLIFCRKIIAISHVPVFPSQSYILPLRRDSLGICSMKGTTDIFLELKFSCAEGSVQREHRYYP